MRPPPHLRVPIGRSRLAALLIAAIGAGSVMVIVLLPWPVWSQAAATVAVVAWAVHRLRADAWRSREDSTIEILVSIDRLIVTRARNDSLRAGYVRNATYVSPSVTAIVWKPDRARLSQRLLILPDMMAAEDFRRLRVMLRYGRSEVDAGTPASQA